jgi:hypothetical protein
VREIDRIDRPTYENNDPRGKKLKVVLISNNLGNGKTFVAGK